MFIFADEDSDQLREAKMLGWELSHALDLRIRKTWFDRVEVGLGATWVGEGNFDLDSW